MCNFPQSYCQKLVTRVSAASSRALLEELTAAGERAFPIGAVVEGAGVRLESGFEVAG